MCRDYQNRCIRCGRIRESAVGMLKVTVAICDALDHLNFIVDPLNGAVGELILKASDDFSGMFLKRPLNAFKGFR